MTDAELWCESRPFCGRRPLEETEVRDLETRIAKQRRRMTLTDRFMVGGVVLLLLGIAIAVAVTIYSDHTSLEVDDIGPLFAIFLMGLGCLGSLLEVLFAPGIAFRLSFGAALILFSIGIAAGEKAESSLQMGVGAGAILVVVIGGCTMMVLRWKDRRWLRPLLEQAAQDCEYGEVLMFGEDEKVEIEILPISHAAVRRAGVPVVEWKFPFVTSVSNVPQSFEAPVIGQTGERVISGGLIYNQRHMSPDEIQELSRIRKRTIRKGIISTAAVTYTCALLLTSFGDRATTVRWLFVLMLGAIYLHKHWLVWRNLRIDVSTGMIVVVRSVDEVEPSVSLAEVLPASRLEWAKNGAPSRWRVSKW